MGINVYFSLNTIVFYYSITIFDKKTGTYKTYNRQCKWWTIQAIFYHGTYLVLWTSFEIMVDHTSHLLPVVQIWPIWDFLSKLVDLWPSFTKNHSPSGHPTNIVLYGLKTICINNEIKPQTALRSLHQTDIHLPKP